MCAATAIRWNGEAYKKSSSAQCSLPQIPVPYVIAVAFCILILTIVPSRNDPSCLSSAFHVTLELGGPLYLSLHTSFLCDPVDVGQVWLLLQTKQNRTIPYNREQAQGLTPSVSRSFYKASSSALLPSPPISAAALLVLIHKSVFEVFLIKCCIIVLDCKRDTGAGLQLPLLEIQNFHSGQVQPHSDICNTEMLPNKKQQTKTYKGKTAAKRQV